ncbi:MAG: hypothetical protein A2651_03320 [Candidatus Yanofskybacteria bacterium RIFCSPHIGHO2_01_FULL_42_12]|uniref:Glycosyltransferase subfamily 4-like N-terminal domain-containing protein n=1 Tax=Candidatus Yanofskybacteria bacterium RIFCSPLOWO2_01_FULL_42_49 TaxID=1802694 RepID=A0A1F8GAX8_9BACT|nr:MAG: hypothetical protein A2651_03320 [Candidatus Yanofskybacteria bacterium RIFCSPHIGHO2_01_FULL_42_12]OGN22190.1 MAG: hypothetical protein A2918_03455 [Candidatus Yanofskybacteria bacterium RIFCSPLOWO2_01_FULL_42_49]
MNKILITTGIFPPDIGGPASYAGFMAGALNGRGFNVGVLTYSRKFRTSNFDSKYKFKIVRVWGKWPIWIKHFIFGIKLLGLARKSDIILALNVWSAGFPSLVVSKILRKKFIVRIVGDYAWEVGVGNGKVKLLIDDFQESKKKGWIGLLYKLQGWVCKKSDLVIVPSKYLNGIVKGWGVPETKIKIVYNGVDFKPSDLSKEEARSKIGIHGNIILSVGRLVPWKGFRMLIKIMPQLLNLNQFARLVIIGDGPDRESLNLMINNLNLDKKVFLAGKKPREELATYLAAADMFVLNSGYEGFSHQILEAMTCGIPVIASAVGGNRELITQGDNGFLVKYNDEFNLVEAIKTIWQNPEFKEGLTESGKDTVARFSSNRMVEETIKILTND